MDAHFRRVGAALFALVLAIYVFTAGGSLTTTDAVVAFEVTRQLVDRQSVALPRDMLGNEAHRGRDGRYYSPFGITQSVFNIPFFIAGRAAAGAAGLSIGRADAIEKAAVALGNTVAMAACVWVCYLFARRVTGSIRTAGACALATAFATPLWPYSKFGFNAPLSALFVTIATYCAWSATRVGVEAGLPPALRLRRTRRSLGGGDESNAGLTSPAWIGWWLGLALLTRHELPILLLPIVVWLYLESSDRAVFLRRIGAVAIGFVPAAAAWCAFNVYRFGHPLDAGYLRDRVPQFGSSIATGLYGLLLSPTASLFVYCPLAIVAVAAIVVLAPRDRAAAVLFGGSVLVLLLFYAQLGNWMGGRSYGPRYLVPVIPLLMLSLVAVNRWNLISSRWEATLVLALSLAVQVPGVVVDYAKFSVAHARAHGAPTADDRLFDWRMSPLALNTTAAVEAIPRNVRWLLGRGEPPPRVRAVSGNAQSDFSQQFADTLDFWWVYLFRMGVASGTTVRLLLVCMLAGIGALSLRYRRLVALAK
jgi:hypothetical protein